MEIFLFLSGETRMIYSPSFSCTLFIYLFFFFFREFAFDDVNNVGNIKILFSDVGIVLFLCGWLELFKVLASCFVRQKNSCLMIIAYTILKSWDLNKYRKIFISLLKVKMIQS